MQSMRATMREEKNWLKMMPLYNERQLYVNGVGDVSNVAAASKQHAVYILYTPGCYQKKKIQ
jgi:hypothetical protein